MRVLSVFLSTLLNGFIIFQINQLVITLILGSAYANETSDFIKNAQFFYSSSVTAIIVLLIYCFNHIGLLEKVIILYQQCRPASKRELTKLEPLVNEVLRFTGYKPLNIFISSIDELNAFALGKKTLCVSKKVLEELSDNEIKAIIGHEVAHLINNDSYFNNIVFCLRIIPEFLYKIVISLLNFCIKVSSIFSNIGPLAILALPLMLIASCFALSVWICLAPLFFIDRRIIPYLEFKTYRNAEYKADMLGAKVSSAKDMLNVLEKIEKSNNGHTQNFFERLLSTHPDISYRIDAMDALVRGEAV